jgi:hypothetical protein
MLSKTLTLASYACAVTLLLAPPADALATVNSDTGLARVLAPAAGSWCQYLPDVDLTNADLTSVGERDKTKCCTYCTRNTNCQAVTWTDYNGGTCWLKASSAGGGTVKKGALTTVTSCTPTYVALPSCDMAGNDMKSVKRSKYQDCFNDCKALNNCVAFTWSDYEGGTCFLKSALSPCISAGNKFSGAMGRGGI